MSLIVQSGGMIAAGVHSEGCVGEVRWAGFSELSGGT